MPSVPIYSGPQIQDTPLQLTQMVAPDGQARAAGGIAQSLMQASDTVGRLAQTAASQQAFDTEIKVKSDWLSKDQELRKQFQGASAVAYPTAVAEYWADKRKELADLPPMSRQIIDKSLGITQLQAQSSAAEYMRVETDRAQTQSFAASKTIEIQRAITDGRPEAVAAAREVLMQKNSQMGALKGWTTEQTQAANLSDLTALHGETITRMAQSDPAAALKYFEANKAEIDASRASGMQTKLMALGAAADGLAAADDVWQQFGPKAYNQPVDRTSMEDAVRKQYKTDKPRLDAALQAIKERAAAFNASEAEHNADNTNAVMKVYAARPGMTVSQVQRMPQFQSLPGKEQAQIVDHIDSHINTLVTRAAAAESRADSAESRSQRRLERNGYATYLQLSDPAVLSTMTEAQVQAQLPVLGNDLTKQLAEKFRSIDAKAGKDLTDAKMDEDSFRHTATQFGYKPFEKMGADDKADLGELKYRVERVIAVAQQSKGKKLTESEKLEVMRQEMARTVKTGGFLGYFQDDKPVIALKKGDVDGVVIPQAERAQIVDALRTMYARDPKNKSYAPTDENVRMLYLRNKSRSAEFLPRVDQPVSYTDEAASVLKGIADSSAGSRGF